SGFVMQAVVQRRFLETQLRLRCQVLQAATTALREMWARWSHAFGGCGEHLQGLGFGIAAALTGELRLHAFTGECAFDEDDAAIEVRDATPFVTETVDIETERLGGRL